MNLSGTENVSILILQRFEDQITFLYEPVMKLPSCVAACCTAFLSDLFVLFRFFVSHVKFVLNWTFDVFAKFPAFVFSKTFSCHFRSHVLADSITEKHYAYYTGYFLGKNFPIYIHLGHLPTVFGTLKYKTWRIVFLPFWQLDISVEISSAYHFFNI